MTPFGTLAERPHPPVVAKAALPKEQLGVEIALIG
jgi:hypothetical protein